MADIVYNYTEMRTAASSIKEIAAKYKSAAESFEQSFIDAIAGWEGETRDKMVAFISGPVVEYLRDSVPALIEGYAALLESNANQMEQVDRQIAESIPTSLGS